MTSSREKRQQQSAPTALVTGAAQGIGKAATERLAAAGIRVFATDRNDAALAPLAALAGVATRRLDVTSGDEVAQTVAEIGAVDILVNCAGLVQAGTILEATEAELQTGIDVNFLSMWRTVRAVLPGMVERRRGSIVNVASIGSSVKGVKARFVYSATKAAVIGLTKSVAADFAAYGICCNAVCPGPIDSPSMRERINAQADPGSAREEMARRVPMGRLGTAEEVAGLIAYLATATYTSGQALVIDGAMTG